MIAFINWFKAGDLFYLKGRQVFTGPAPYDFDTGDLSPLLNIPWVISHPRARKDCMYKCIAVERFMIAGTYHRGTPIGLMVEEIYE